MIEIGVTLKAGEGFAHAWIPIKSTHEDPAQAAADLMETIVHVTGVTEGENVAQMTVAGSLYVRGINTAAEKLGREPQTLAPVNAPAPEPEAPTQEKPKKRAAKGGLAAQAKAAKAESAEPADVTNDIPSLIANIMEEAEAKDLYSRFEADWKPEYTQLVKSRLKELNN